MDKVSLDELKKIKKESIKLRLDTIHKDNSKSIHTGDILSVLFKVTGFSMFFVSLISLTSNLITPGDISLFNGMSNDMKVLGESIGGMALGLVIDNSTKLAKDKDFNYRLYLVLNKLVRYVDVDNVSRIIPIHFLLNDDNFLNYIFFMYSNKLRYSTADWKLKCIIDIITDKKIIKEEDINLENYNLILNQDGYYLSFDDIVKLADELNVKFNRYLKSCKDSKELKNEVYNNKLNKEIKNQLLIN